MAKHPLNIRLFNTVEPVTTFYHDLIPYWEARGWRTEVFISRAEYRPHRNMNWIGDLTRVHWTPNLGQSTSSRFGKLIIMMAYILSTALRTLLGQTADRNIFLTQPPLFYLWGFVLQWLRRQPYCIVLMDLYPEVAIQAGLLKSDSLVTKLLGRLSHFGLRHADGVIVIGRHMRQKVLDLGVRQERIHFIPNWADGESVYPIPHASNRFRAAQGWQDKFVVLYSGNMGTAHYFDDLLEVCYRLRTQTDIIFGFIGSGRRQIEIEEFKEAHQLDNIVTLPFQPQENLAETLSSGNIHFVSLQEGYAGLVVPSKIYGILAVGLPTIYQGEAIGEIARMIYEQDVGAVIPLKQPSELERSIMAYKDDPVICSCQSRKARSLAESSYNKLSACERYTTVITNLAS